MSAPSAAGAWEAICEQCRSARPDSRLASALAFIHATEVTKDGELVLEAEGSVFDLVQRGYGRYIETRAKQLGLRGVLLRRATPERSST